MKVFYDKDCDLSVIKGKTVAILGYGSQGHAHLLNLRDSGVEDICVGLRADSGSIAKAEAEGIAVKDIAEDFHAVGAVVEVEGAVLGVMVAATALVVVEVIMAEPVAEHAGVLARLDDATVL